MTNQTWKLLDSVHGWMGRSECEWLANLAQTVTSWTEIGVWCGRSLLTVALHLPNESQLQAVDLLFDSEIFTKKGIERFKSTVSYHYDLDLTIPQQQLPNTVDMIMRERPDLILSLYGSPSAEAAKDAEDTEVCFLDAGHKYEDVHSDIISWQKKCRILCGHDYQPNWKGVMRAVDELCPNSFNPAGTIWVRRR